MSPGTALHCVGANFGLSKKYCSVWWLQCLGARKNSSRYTCFGSDVNGKSGRRKYQSLVPCSCASQACACPCSCRQSYSHTNQCSRAHIHQPMTVQQSTHQRVKYRNVGLDGESKLTLRIMPRKHRGNMEINGNENPGRKSTRGTA